MKKTTFFMAITLFFSLLVMGCSDTSNDEQTESESVDQISTEEIVEDTSLEEVEEEDQKQEDSSASLFDTQKNEGSYYYEVYTDSEDGTSHQTKLWASGDKNKLESYYPESDETVIIITDEEEGVMYTYRPAENMALMLNYNGGSTSEEDDEPSDTQDYIDFMTELADDDEATVEDATFEGEPVKLITNETDGNTHKIWFSTKTNFPLKSELYIDGELDSTSVIKNFEEKSIDPSIFKLPDGVEIQDLTSF